ncbi:hypothetical protein ANCDUO_14657, partial [Ancylostoma duodenale]
YGPSEFHSKLLRIYANPAKGQTPFGARSPYPGKTSCIMVRANPECDVIIEMHKGGLPSKKISSVSGAPIGMVRNTIKRFMELGTNADKPNRGRKPTVMVSRMIKTVRELIRRNPRHSMRKMATNLDIAASSVRNTVRKKLNLKPFRMQAAHFLNVRMKVIRWQRCKALLKSQNDRILSRTPSEAIRKGKIIRRAEHPKWVMVWGAITSDGKTPLVFVESGVKINKDLYLKTILEDVLKPWPISHFGEKKWCFQQDSASAHKAKTIQRWCQKELPDFIAYKGWPSNSPDLNPLDFSGWSVLEA